MLLPSRWQALAKIKQPEPVGSLPDEKRSPPGSATSPAAQGYIHAGPYALLLPTAACSLSAGLAAQVRSGARLHKVACDL
eukprot:364847-Chlamydomonas_euryale.AAC.5